eukprot:gene3236-32007_t
MFPEPPLVSAMEACIGVGCAVLPAGCAANVLPLSQVGGVDIVPCFLNYNFLSGGNQEDLRTKRKRYRSERLVTSWLKMLIFCPTCGNMLTVHEHDDGGELAFACSTCPYRKQVTIKMSTRHMAGVEKEIVDIEDVNNAKDTRPTADLGDGYFHTMQTRSADEASTIYYQCTSKDCQESWTEEP